MRKLHLLVAGFIATLASLFKVPATITSRFRTHDISYLYRMPGGIPGDVNRTHPAWIEPCVNDPSTPVPLFGVPVVCTATGNSVRPIGAGDGSLTNIYGFSVRPYPFQQANATNYGEADLGAGVPPLNQPLDVMRTGAMTVFLNGSAAVVKGGRVYVWIGASGGGHIRGGLEGASDTASTIELNDNILWNGPADPQGNVELTRIG